MKKNLIVTEPAVKGDYSVQSHFRSSQLYIWSFYLCFLLIMLRNIVLWVTVQITRLSVAETRTISFCQFLIWGYYSSILNMTKLREWRNEQTNRIGKICWKQWKLFWFEFRQRRELSMCWSQLEIQANKVVTDRKRLSRR